MHRRLAAFKGVRKFYKELWKWIVAGRPYHRIFCNDRALCISLRLYLSDCTDMKMYEQELVHRIHSDVFLEVWGDGGLPFNRNIHSFANERRDCKVYKNQLRLAWIYKQSR